MKGWFWFLIVAILLCSCASPKFGSAKSKDSVRVLESSNKFGGWTRPGGKLSKIHFSSDYYVLSDEAREILRNNAEWLKMHPDTVIQIEGHCDERGSVEYNLALGEHRAQMARNFLIRLGIDGERIHVISYGESMPIDRGHNEASWAKNRRGLFKRIKRNRVSISFRF